MTVMDDQLQRLTEQIAEIKGVLRTAQIILGSTVGFMVAVTSCFGVVFYKQGLDSRDIISRLVQRVEDMPKNILEEQQDHERRITRLETNQEMVIRKLGF